MAQLKAVKEFQKGVVDAISGKKVTVAATLISSAVAQSAATASTNPSVGTDGTGRATETGAVSQAAAGDIAASPNSTARAASSTVTEQANEVATSPTPDELAVDYGDEEDDDDTDATQPTHRPATTDMNTIGDAAETSATAMDADGDLAAAEPTGAAKLLSLTEKLQGIVQQQGVKIRTADPNAPKKWTRADIRKVSRDAVG